MAFSTSTRLRATILSRIEIMGGGGILLAAVLCGAATAAAPGAAALTTAARLDLLSLITAVAAIPAIGLVVWRRWYRLAGAAWVRPVSPALGLGLFIGMFVLGWLGAIVARRMVLGDTSADAIKDLPLAGHAQLLIGHAIGQAVAVVIYLWLCRTGSGRARPTVRTAVVTGLLAMVVVWPIVAGTSMVTSYVARVIEGGPVDVIAHDTLAQLAESSFGPWHVVMSIQLVLIVPLLEEVLYRGILQRTLKSLDLGGWTGIVITSVVFVAMHRGVAQWHALPALFVLSLGFGWVYERTGRLAAPIAMHSMFNALNLALLWWSLRDVSG